MYSIRRGQLQFDIFTQEQNIAEVDAKMTTYSEAVGSLEDDRFTGNFFGGAEVVYDCPAIRHSQSIFQVFFTSSFATDRFPTTKSGSLRLAAKILSTLPGS